MKVYKVSPIVKYSPFFTLTYVSKENFEVGNIVPINFNKREIFAVVLEVYNLKDARVEIRKADFQTKKIEKRLEKEKENLLDRKLFEILKKFSEDFGVAVGELVWFMCGDTPDPRGSKELLDPRGSGVIYFPDDLSLKVASGKKDKEKLKNVFRGRDIFKIILEKNNFETLTIKDFNFDKYLDFQAPHISKLDLLFEILKVGGTVQKIILETDFLGVVEKNFLDENVVDGRLFGKYILEIAEEKNKAKKFLVKVGRDKNGEEEMIPKEVLEILKPHPTSPLKRGGAQKVFMFVLSHGYADRIFCNDCKKSYDCENCAHPYSILNEETGRYLFCKNCKHKKVLLEDQYLICKHCGSWRIFPFGVGGQKVKEFLEREGEEVVLIDELEKKLSVKKISEKINLFLENNENNILIGSIRTLKILKGILEKEKSKVDKSFVISTGPLVRGKYFDSDEKLLKLISEIENISKEVYINKREGDEISLENYKDKEKFVEEEIKFRKSAGLPPEKKVLSLITDYRNGRAIDKLKPDGEIKKGKKIVFYWFIAKNAGKEKAEILRQFGDVIIANSIIEQSALGKVK